MVPLSSRERGPAWHALLPRGPPLSSCPSCASPCSSPSSSGRWAAARQGPTSCRSRWALEEGLPDATRREGALRPEQLPGDVQQAVPQPGAGRRRPAGTRALPGRQPRVGPRQGGRARRAASLRTVSPPQCPPREMFPAEAYLFPHAARRGPPASQPRQPVHERFRGPHAPCEHVDLPPPTGRATELGEEARGPLNQLRLVIPADVNGP
jgi:hypothetical protein